MRLFYFTCWQYVVLYVLLYVILLILLNDQPERANHTCKLFLLTQIVYLGNKAYFETLYYWKFLSLNSFSLCFTAGKLKKRSLIRFLGISSSISSGKSMARVSSNILIGIKSLKTFILPSMIDMNRVTQNLWLENLNNNGLSVEPLPSERLSMALLI